MNRLSSTRTLGLLTLCAAAAIGGSLVWPPARSGETAAAHPGGAAVSGGLALLDRLPAVPAGSASATALAAAVARVRTFSSQAKPWIDLGDALAQCQRDTADPAFYDPAEAAYSKALTLASDNTAALSGLAWVFGGRHIFDESVKWADAALAVDDKCAAAWGIRGDASLELGNYDAALDDYQRMMDARPDLSSWSRGAWALWVTGDKSKALWLMDKAVRSGAAYAENSAWCRAKLAMMLFSDGALVPARQALEPALAAGTKNPHIVLAAATLATARRDFPAAEGYLQQLLAAGPHMEALAMLGDLRALEGDAAGAERYFTQVDELHAANTKAGVHDHTVMARFLADHDRNLPAALLLAEQHRTSRNVLECDVLAWVYFKNGVMDKAIECMKRALSQRTPDPLMHYHAGCIAAAAGDLTSARKHLELALSCNPAFHPVYSVAAVQKLEEIRPGGRLAAAAHAIPAPTGQTNGQ